MNTTYIIVDNFIFLKKCNAKKIPVYIWNSINFLRKFQLNMNSIISNTYVLFNDVTLVKKYF